MSLFFEMMSFSQLFAHLDARFSILNSRWYLSGEVEGSYVIGRHKNRTRKRERDKVSGRVHLDERSLKLISDYFGFRFATISIC